MGIGGVEGLGRGGGKGGAGGGREGGGDEGEEDEGIRCDKKFPILGKLHLPKLF